MDSIGLAIRWVLSTQQHYHIGVEIVRHNKTSSWHSIVEGALKMRQETMQLGFIM